MSVYFNPSMLAVTVSRNLNAAYSRLHQRTQELTSGTSAPPAAGFTLIDRVAADMALVTQATADTNVRIARYETADAALAGIGERLARMRELAGRVSTGAYNAKEVAEMDAEYQQLAAEVAEAVAETASGGAAVLSGADAVASVDYSAVTAIVLDPLTDGALSDLSTAIVDTALARADVAVTLSREQDALADLANHGENLLGFGSRIANCDLALATTGQLTTGIQLLFETALAAQANINADRAVSLLNLGWRSYP